MKKVLICVAVLCLGCAPKKQASNKTPAVKLESSCPENADCSIEIFNNKKLLVKHDEFENYYYSLDDNLDTKVIKYSYSRKTKSGIQDAGYREEIVFEVEHTNDQVFTNEDLQKTKMLFGRFCYCKGQTGNYRVTSGKLAIENQQATLDFTVSEVPQIITSIRFSIK